MKKFHAILVASLAFILLNCSPISVKSDYDQGVDFSSYKTFGWVDMKNAAGPIHRNPVMAGQVRAAVEREMQAKGFTKTDGDNADLKIAFHAGVKDKIDVTTHGYGYWRRRGPHVVAVDVHQYKEGTLVLDFVDTKEKQLVWRGWGTGVIGDPSEAVEKIGKAVTKILEKFPPQG